MGRYLCTDEGLVDRFIDLAEAHDNLLLDLSGVVLLNKIPQAIDLIGAGRLLFGTDGPHLKPDTVGFARAELDKIRGLHLDPADEDAILGGTIARLLGI